MTFAILSFYFWKQIFTLVAINIIYLIAYDIFKVEPITASSIIAILMEIITYYIMNPSLILSLVGLPLLAIGYLLIYIGAATNTLLTFYQRFIISVFLLTVIITAFAIFNAN
jgi:hypothetical protein